MKQTNEMNKYIGTKVINAKPMNRLEYNQFRGWVLPDDENGEDEGFLVEYVDGGKPNTEHFKGYVSWSPKDVFERAYKESGNLSFGEALTAIKNGLKVARSGWNGKGMWIALGLGAPKLSADMFWNPHSKQHAIDNGGSADVDPYIIMKTASGSICMGWLASQADMLANDWEIV